MGWKNGVPDALTKQTYEMMDVDINDPHWLTLLKECRNCGWYTQFEDEHPETKTSITSGPRDLRCMNCGSITLHNPTSFRSFAFDKKGSKVKVWDPSSCPPSMFGNSTP